VCGGASKEASGSSHASRIKGGGGSEKRELSDSILPRSWIPVSMSASDPRNLEDSGGGAPESLIRSEGNEGKKGRKDSNSWSSLLKIRRRAQ